MQPTYKGRPDPLEREPEPRPLDFVMLEVLTRLASNESTWMDAVDATLARGEVDEGEALGLKTFLRKLLAR